MKQASGVQAQRPWYREPWPWILMSGPAAVIVAGAFTTYLAIAHEDALVADNYYKEGLAINRILQREDVALRGGYSAQVMFSPDGQRVRVRLEGAVDAPAALRLHMVHPTRADLDADISLASMQAGWYEGKMKLASAPRWTLQLEDEAGSWRLTGSWRPTEGAEVALRPHG